jgi:hypothetical protein
MKSALSFTLIVCLLSAGVPVAAQDGAKRPSLGSLRAAIDREAARLAQTTQLIPSEPKEQRQNWFTRHPVLVGTLIGGGVGLALDGRAYNSVSQPAFPSTPIGLGLGALGGLAASAIIGSNLTYTAVDQPDIVAVQRIVGKIGAGGQVVIISGSSGQTSGRIQVIGQDELTLVPESQTPSVQVAYADVRSIRPKPLSTGAKVGIGVAATVIGVLALVLPSHLGG